MMKNSLDSLNRLYQEMTAAGLNLNAIQDIILDGKFKNVATSEDPNKKSGWYIGQQYHLSGREYTHCTFGDFKLDYRQVFKSWSEQDQITKADRDALAEKQKQQQRTIEQQLKRKHKQAADAAVKEWGSLVLTGESQYLNKKGVQGYGIRYGRSHGNPFIAIPINDMDGTILGLQKIFDRNLFRFQSRTRGAEKSWNANSRQTW